MKRSLKIYLTLGIFLLVLVWRAWPMIGIFTESNLRVSDDFNLLNQIVPPRTEAALSYEGFSHPYWETERLCFEILLKPRRIFHGHAFRHPASENDTAKKVGILLSDPSSFQQWRGNKACGGFHADRYFRWTRGAEVWEVLLCMGCHEALLFHDGQSLRCDLSREGAKAIDVIEKEHESGTGHQHE